MGRDGNDDEPVTQINVEVDPSAVAEITFSRTADPGSPADNEPLTLEPQTIQPRLSVRGLAAAPHSTTLSSADSAAEADDEDMTTQSVEARLLGVYAKEQARRVSRAAFGPIITPSEPFRVTSPHGIEITQATKAASSGSLRVSSAAATDPELSEPTAKRPPHEVLDDNGVEDDETKTDAMKTLASQELVYEVDVAVTADALPAEPAAATVRKPDAEDDEEEEETRKEAQKNVALAIAGTAPGAYPARHDKTVRLADDASADPVVGTMRLAFPKSASALVYDAPPPAAGRPPPVPPPPPQQPLPYSAPSPPAMAGGHPPPAKDMRPLAPTVIAPVVAKKRGNGRLFVVLFVMAASLSGAAVFYRRNRPALPSWLRRAPAATAPVVVPVPTPSASASAAPSADVEGGAPAAPSASASASASASPSASASASASASPSASASGRGRNRRPRK